MATGTGGVIVVNEEKIRIMTRLALYEDKVSQTELKEGGYYKSDYIRAHLMTAIWSYTVAFVLMLALLALYHFEYLVSDVGMQDIRSLSVAVAAIYLLVLLCCIFFSVTVSSVQYNQLQKKRKEYYNELKRLEAFYNQNKEGGNG